MAYGKPVWGIDVGQSALKALKLRWGSNGPEVMAVDIIKHPKILSQPDADEEQLIRDALEKFASRNATQGERVVISVPGQAAFARFIKLPPVERKKIPEIVRYEARQQIPFAIEDVLWDYQPVGTEPAGLETEIGLFAMKKDMINDFVSNFVMANIEVEIVQIAPLALYNFLVADEQVGQGATVLLDVGAENTNLLITDGNRIWLRNIPLGGNNFTRAISKARKLTFGNAETEKRSLRQQKDAREIFAAIQPIFAEFVAEVQRSMGYFTSLHRDVRIERILGMGGAFRTPGLRRYLAQNLQYRVDDLRAFNNLTEASVLQTREVRTHFLSLPTAYGLALQGLEVAPIYTNLLPPEIRRARIIRQKRPLAAVAVGILVLAVGLSAIDAAVKRSSAVNPAIEAAAKPVLATADRYKKDYDKVMGGVKELSSSAEPLLATVEWRGTQLVVLNEFFSILNDVNEQARRETGRPDAGVRLSGLTRTEVVASPEDYLGGFRVDDGRERRPGRGDREGRPERDTPRGVALEDPSIAGKQCWVYTFSGYVRAEKDRWQVPPVVKQFFARFKQSTLFTQGTLQQPVSRYERTIPYLTDPSKPMSTDIDIRQVTEWRISMQFLCVVERVKDRARELAKAQED